MIVVLNDNATDEEIQIIKDRLTDFGFGIHESVGKSTTIIGAIGVKPEFDTRKIKILAGVADVLRVSKPYKLASRDFQHPNTVIELGKSKIGSNDITMIAGPCSIESEDQIFRLAKVVKESDATILRGGAFKPRTSPYSFQGLGVEGLKLIRAAADEYDLKVVTEIMEISQIDDVYKYSDIFQVGARNMQNFSLLKQLGVIDKPVMLKRGISATIEEWLMSAEYLLAGGNKEVFLCERGIRTYEKYTRNTFDISAIPIVHDKSHLPIIADPSHAIGMRSMVAPLARAAVAAGADGLMIEIHDDPKNALSDGPQALLPEQFLKLMSELKIIAESIGRNFV